jgi:hypothetical protein
MKTSILIIMGIVLTSAVIGSVYAASVQIRCEDLLGDTKYPRPLTWWNCYEYLQRVDNPPPKTTTPESEPEKQENNDSVYSLPFGMTTEDIENMIRVEPIYRNNPNNSGELILDIDAMQQVQKILNKCDYVQKLESGEIPAQNLDGSYNIVTSSLRFYNNGTHYIDSSSCDWIDSLKALTHHCFEAKPTEQNWYFGPNYFDNGTHRLDVQYCEWKEK